MRGADQLCVVGQCRPHGLALCQLRCEGEGGILAGQLVPQVSRTLGDLRM